MLPVKPDELEAAARERLSPAAFAFYASGAGSEHSVAANVEAWSRWMLRPRIGVDVREVSTAVAVLGARVELPVLIAPCGLNRLAHPDGELAVARAAAAAGTIHVLSTTSTIAMEDVARATSAPKWFQLYSDPDPAVTDVRLKRAEDAGFGAIALTVDSPELGIRYQGLSDLRAFMDELTPLLAEPIVAFNPVLDWAEIDRINATTELPVLLKGVLHPDDAERAADLGLAGVIVSNHGARQLDGTIPPALALPDIVEAVRGRLELYVDGGVRSGVDVLRALALGAQAVLIGRPYLWALAIDGEAGVTELLQRFRRELRNAMTLAGQCDATAVDRSLVVRD
jgi:4-hydroxymandelate oxidase